MNALLGLVTTYHQKVLDKLKNEILNPFFKTMEPIWVYLEIWYLEFCDRLTYLAY